MTTGSENQNGEFRCPAPDEIAAVVKNRRELRGMKQLTLAQLAGVTERTIQRMEGGQKVDGETLRQVAVALGLAPQSFVGPRLIRGLEHAVETVTDFFDNHQFVQAHLVLDWRAFDALMQVQGIVVEDSEISADAAELVTGLRDYLGESLDFSDLLDSTGRMEHAKVMYEKLQAVQSTGVVARYAVADTKEGLKIGALILLPKDHERAKVSQALFPTHFVGMMGPGPSQDALRIADTLIDAAKTSQPKSVPS